LVSSEAEIRLDERNRWASILKAWAEFCADNGAVERSFALWDAADVLIDDNSEPFIRGPAPRANASAMRDREPLELPNFEKPTFEEVEKWVRDRKP
jgi:hypothetical protein